MIYIIYKITCLETSEAYFGKTKQTLKQRMLAHNNTTNSCSSKKIIERNNYEVEELERCEEEDSIDRERYYIRHFNCLNKCTPNRTKAEWYLDNKEKIKKRNKEHHHNNKEKRNKKKKQYTLNNKEHIKNQQWWSRTYHLGILARNYFD